MKILLLEDNRRLSNLIVEALQEKNYHVDLFADGKKALDAIYNGYDCFILDINVPSLDGLTLLKEIKSIDESTPSIIISANVDLDTIKEAYSNGCNEYLKKPFYIYELETKLDQLCIKTDEIVPLLNEYSYDIKNEVLYDEKKNAIKLSKKEIRLLHLFIKNLEKVVTFELIEQYVWEGDLTINDNIRALVKRLRKKLPMNTIISQGGLGYKFYIAKI